MKDITIALLGIALACSYISNYKRLKEITCESDRSNQESQNSTNPHNSIPVYRNIFLSGFGIAIIGIISAIFQ